jgi:hypothetical protein
MTKAGRRRRWRYLGLAILLSLVGFWTWRNRVDLAAFPGILPAFTAKEYCSCRFVMGQGDAACRRHVRQYLPIDTLVVDEAARRVTVRATAATRSARWFSTREGCRLE